MEKQPLQNDQNVESLIFGNIVLDGARGKLLVDSREVPLRPKTYKVMQHLARNPNRLIQKQELMDEVWPGSVVTDDSLTQCITEIRKAIGDDSKSVIKTIPRRGFIFDAPESVETATPQNKRATLAAIFSAMAITLGVLALWQSHRDTLSESPIFVSVLEFESDSENLRLGARLLAESLRLRLAEIPGVTTRSLGTAETSPTIFLEQAEELQIDWLLAGRIETVVGAKNDKVTLELWDIDRQASHSLGVFSIPIGADVNSTRDFVQQRDLVLERALTRLPAYLVNEPADHMFPTRLSDFEIYAETMTALEKEQCNQTLVDAMTPVVTRNPEFMRGWMAMAWSHWVDSWACGLGEDSLSGAIAASDRVLELEPNYPQAIKVKTSVLAAQGDVQAAQAVAKSAVEESPQRAANWATLSYLLNYSGAIDESSKAMEHALELDPLVLIAETGETPNVYLYANEWDRFLQTQPPFDAPYFNFQRAYAHFRLGDLDKALRITEATIKSAPTDRYSNFAAALKAIIENDLETARQTLQLISKQREEANQADGETTYRQAILFRLAGADTLAVENLWAAYRQNFVCPECIRRDPAWRELFDDPRLKKWLEATDAEL